MSEVFRDFLHSLKIDEEILNKLSPSASISLLIRYSDLSLHSIRRYNLCN
jgi:hypothetical protein